MRNVRARLLMPILVAVAATVGLLTTASPAAAQSAADIAAEIERSGRYLEFDDSDVDGAVDDANGSGIAFVWLERGGDGGSAEALADAVLVELLDSGGRYRTVLVLLDGGIGAKSDGVPEPTINDALDSSLAAFSSAAVATGVEVFTDTVAGRLNPTPTTAGSGSDGSGSGGGIGLGTILVSLLVLGGGFWLVRNWSTKRRAKRRLVADLTADREEIREQLRDNADHVIDLGDRAVDSGDHELIAAYERASQAYQQVSQEIDGAETVEEVDRLDDMIDQAEWEFDMIEARLDGRPVPPSPAEVEAAESEAAEAEAARRRAEADKPALGPDEYVVSSGPARNQAPRTGRRPPRRSTRPGGFGGMGGGLGGLLGSVVLGGGGPGRSRTRRTRRRTSGSRGGGSLGGGVLRPGGRSRRSGGGRSIGSRRSGGGRDL